MNTPQNSDPFLLRLAIFVFKNRLDLCLVLCLLMLAAMFFGVMVYAISQIGVPGF